MVRPSGYRDDKGRLGIGMRGERLTAFLWAFFSRQGFFILIFFFLSIKNERRIICTLTTK